ncbi:MAG TPA: hypothetical protein VEV84_14550, partial [Pyrinomonadaceae bacterium]|nr:hypothetical protein [Pyrinomonadaceae bacterium]
MFNKTSTHTLLFLTIVVLILSSDTSIKAAASPTLNESVVLRSLRTLHEAESAYYATTGNGSYGTLSSMASVGLIDPALGSGYKFGYSFIVTFSLASPTNPAEFQITATPRKYAVGGRLSFYIETEGLIHAADKKGQVANNADPLLPVGACADGTIAGSETCIIQSLRTLHGAESTYAATHGNGSYGSLAQLAAVNLISQSLGTGQWGGYAITVVTTPPT